VLNLEPRIAEALSRSLETRPDRATVKRLVDPEENGASEARLTPAPAKPAGEKKSATGRSGLRRTRSSLVTRHPIVFCHGMLAYSTLRMQLPEDLNCFSPLGDFLRGRGFRVLFPQVPPTGGVVERAARLREQILNWTGEPINIIAHSMGGLDARYLVTHLGMAEQVRSLTTVSTPHRGTYLADWFVANFRQRVPLLLAMEAFGVNVDGFRDCRLDACRAFNERTPDRPEVRYFSYGGQVSHARVSPGLRRAWNLVMPVEGPNDGMVSVASSRWGQYLGTIHADHFAQTPDARFLRPDEDFDTLGFYSRLVEDLARRGF
jgi:triacylglycerol lipase